MNKNCEARVYQSIKQVFSEASRQITLQRTLSVKEGDLWTVLKTFGLDLSVLWSDDSFEFSRGVSALKKIIVDFDTDFGRLNKL